MTPPQLYMEVPNKPNHYFNAFMRINGELIEPFTQFTKRLYSKFPELTRSEIGDTQLNAVYMKDFPLFYSKLGDEVIRPLFGLANYVKTENRVEVSFSPPIPGPEFSRYLVMSPRVKPEEMINRLHVFASQNLAHIVRNPRLEGEQTSADGFTIQIEVTPVPTKYSKRTERLNPTLPIGDIEGLLSGRRPFETARITQKSTEYELDLNKTPARIPEELQSYRIDAKIGLLFR